VKLAHTVLPAVCPHHMHTLDIQYVLAWLAVLGQGSINKNAAYHSEAMKWNNLRICNCLLHYFPNISEKTLSSNSWLFLNPKYHQVLSTLTNAHTHLFIFPHI
jgi:hypothetical protein